MNAVGDPELAGADVPIVVVGLGASAGGVEALRSFFAALTDVDDVAFVVIPGVDATATSPWADALGHATAMPIVPIAERQALRGGHVFLASEHGVIDVTHGHVTVVLDDRDAARGTIDDALTAIAQAYGPRSVGILLSGTGSDGTMGLGAITSVGGLSMVQDDASSQFDAMPRNAVASGVVDHVLAPVRLAEELVAHVDHIRRTSQAAEVPTQSRIEGVLAQICTELQRSTGHGLHQYKPTTLQRRIERRMQILRVTDAEAYLAMLRADADEASILLREVLIGVTAFFRDLEAFEVLAEQVISPLIRMRRREEVVRVWVPGCATGEEAYSIAMLLREVLDACDDPPAAQVFATDIDERALAFARAGSYPDRIEESVSPERLARFFQRRGSRWQVTPELREMCMFASHNLVSDPPFSRLDLISCRNVLIYLGQPLQEKLLSIFHYALKPNGVLFLGPSENIVAHTELFQPVSAKHRISHSKPSATRTAGLSHRREGTRSLDGGAPGAPLDHRDLHLIAQRIMLDEFMPSYVIVDEQGQVLVVSARIERYLEFGEGVFKNSVINMLKPALRSTVRPAFTEAAQTRKKVVRTAVSGELAAGITITVQPMPRLGEAEDLFMIVFHEGAVAVERDASRDSIAPASETFVEQLERELAITREDLERSIQDLEAVNEELKSSNEELLSINEELQSANEELETSKEEVQSGNEALAHTNSDLENLLSSSEIATIFLDDDLRVQRFTPSARAIYNLLPVDVGRPIDHITHRARQMPPLPDPAIVSVAGPTEHELATIDGRVYLRRVLPYLTGDGLQCGIVATFTDVTALRQSELLVREHAAQLEAAATQVVEEATRAKSELLARISDDVRAPLTTILAEAAALAPRITDPEDRARIDTIRRSGEQLLAKLDDILAHSQMPASVPETSY